jgi:hypothetical protein
MGSGMGVSSARPARPLTSFEQMYELLHCTTIPRDPVNRLGARFAGTARRRRLPCSGGLRGRPTPSRRGPRCTETRRVRRRVSEAARGGGGRVSGAGRPCAARERRLVARSDLRVHRDHRGPAPPLSRRRVGRASSAAGPGPGRGLDVARRVHLGLRMAQQGSPPARGAAAGTRSRTAELPGRVRGPGGRAPRRGESHRPRPAAVRRGPRRRHVHSARSLGGRLGRDPARPPATT